MTARGERFEIRITIAALLLSGILAASSRPRDFSPATLSVGRAPTSVVTVGDRAFVVCLGAASVYVIDLPEAEIVSVLPVGYLPEGLNISSDGTRVLACGRWNPPVFGFPFDDCSTFVVSPAGGLVTVIEAASASIETVIPIPGDDPKQVFIGNDPDRAFAVLSRGEIASIDLRRAVVTGRIPLGLSQIDTALLDPDGRIYVLESIFFNGFKVFDPGSGMVSDLSLNGTGFDLFYGGPPRFDPSGSFLFVNAFRAGFLYALMVDPDSGRIEASVLGGYGGIDFSAPGKTVYLLDPNYPWDRGLAYSLERREIEGTLPVGGPAAAMGANGRLLIGRFGGLPGHRVQMGPDFPFLYELAVYDTNAGKLEEIPLSQRPLLCSYERGLAVSRDGRYGIITNSALDTVTIFAADRDRRTGRH